MTPDQRPPGRYRKAAAVLALAAVLFVVPAPGAADATDQVQSLQGIPADAAGYFAMLRNREQLEIITQSRAWARLLALPLVKQAWAQAEAQWTDPAGSLRALREWYEVPANAALVRFLGELGSDEVFCYVGRDTVVLLDLWLEVNAAGQFGPLELAAAGRLDAFEDPLLQSKLMLRTLAQNADRIKVPTLVIGFCLRAPQQAQPHLERLDKLMTELTKQHPQLKGRWQRTKAAGADAYTFTLDGSLVPWDEVPFADLEEKPGEFDRLVKKLKGLKLTVTVGVRENFLLIGIGESPKILDSLGQGPKLADRPEFTPLAKFADHKLTFVSYTSKELRETATGYRHNLKGLVRLLNRLQENPHLTKDAMARLRKDTQTLEADLATLTPAAGPAMSFSFLTDSGWESYSYDWSPAPGLDGSKPLTILRHAGGAPLLVAAVRSRSDPAHYELLVKWLRKAHDYFEELVVAKLEDEQKKQYEQVMKVARPLLRRLDKATGQLLLPALADGQVAFVLDGKLASKQWHPALPAAQKPLAILEPALVVGVSDPEKLVQAFHEYRAIANDLLAALHKLAPDQVPEIRIPDPEVKKLPQGTAYYYPLPKEWGLDERLVLATGVSDSVATLAISLDHTERLLAAKPLQAKVGPLAQAKGPLAAAVSLDWPGLLDVAGPWLELALQATDNAGDPNAADSPLAQLREVLAILRVFRGYSSITSVEGKALVTHSAFAVRDLEK